jgi:ribonuclease J
LVTSEATGSPVLELIPLGGLGEFGMNMMLVACGETAILVDAGVMFPEPDMLGVDLIIPDLRPLLSRYRIQALVLTHGHEDHIGAVPHIVGHFDGPIYGTKLTLAFLEPKLEDHGAEVRARLTEVSPRDRVTVGSFTIEFLRVTHSMPDCVAVAIHTPAGVVLHTGDFKIDQTPLDGQQIDFQRFAQLGAEGVLVMMGDSTNVDRKGVSGSERDVVDGFEEVFTSARGRIVIAMFSSSLYRMQILVDLADQFDRKVAFVGRGVMENSQIAMRLGYLRVPPGVQIRDSDIKSYPSQDVAIICTGSQGEPQARP